MRATLYDRPLTSTLKSTERPSARGGGTFPLIVNPAPSLLRRVDRLFQTGKGNATVEMLRRASEETGGAPDSEERGCNYRHNASLEPQREMEQGNDIRAQLCSLLTPLCSGSSFQLSLLFPLPLPTPLLLLPITPSLHRLFIFPSSSSLSFESL